MKLLKQHIEALIFTADQPVTPDEIINCLKTVYGWDLTKKEVQDVFAELKSRYDDEEYGFELNEIGGGYQFLSKKEYHTSIHVMLQLKERKRLSNAALETLSIIAYKQPVTKPDLEQIRGVSCDYSIQKLLEKDLIVISGKSDGPGRPLLYKTSPTFMDHFGLSSVKDLPKLKDIHPEQNEIGIPSELSDPNEPVGELRSSDSAGSTEETSPSLEEGSAILPEEQQDDQVQHPSAEEPETAEAVEEILRESADTEETFREEQEDEIPGSTANS